MLFVVAACWLNSLLTCATSPYFRTPPPSLLPPSLPHLPLCTAGVVTAVAYHPNEPILASASTDKKIYLGELTV